MNLNSFIQLGIVDFGEIMRKGLRIDLYSIKYAIKDIV